MPPQGTTDDAPAPFQRAVDSLRGVTVRPEVHLEAIPAPRRLAPHATALSGTVTVGEDDAAALGRLIVLYDPDGSRDWPGPFRVVAYAGAELEAEIAADPLIGQVAWSWLVEALDAAGATHSSLSGTVTRATTEGYGQKADQPPSTEVELRASWTPDSEDLSGHLAAWVALLASVAGLPPVDVADLGRRRPVPGANGNGG
ncbi:DUF3000 domain-containing protein [Spiractinospora alimapuensis]|uniref:DUF3000 domain-containing protein n=1 Tax=Spiractinospora alimapuensis TaxID=2820884 RepID=UPI001F15BACF|nr:DUF3000 domain-containing protein [Spiractinospora alimapuensis]QVQ52425.1 DUF3000 domain-containing protein [Spiractinospora alimapuensis]